MNCHNGDLYLESAIDSLIAQSYKNYEIIFFDNCSTDNSLKIIKNYKDSRIKIIENKRFISLPEARNEAIKYSKGEFIAILDTDDLAEYNRIEKQIEFMLMNTEISLISANCNFIDENSRIISQTNIPTQQKDIKKKVYWSYPFNNPTLFFRRSIFFTVGGYDTKYKFINDYAFVINVISVSKVSNLELYLGSYRVHQNNLSSKYNIDMKIEHVTFLIKLLSDPKNKTKLITLYYIFKSIIKILIDFICKIIL